MPSRHRTDRVAARHDFCNNPRLVLITPLPPTPGSGEDLKPPHRLRDSSMHCVHSKPNSPNQTADSQITTSSGRCSLNSAYVEAGFEPSSPLGRTRSQSADAVDPPNGT